MLYVRILYDELSTISHVIDNNVYFTSYEQIQYKTDVMVNQHECYK